MHRGCDVINRAADLVEIQCLPGLLHTALQLLYRVRISGLCLLLQPSPDVLDLVEIWRLAGMGFQPYLMVLEPLLSDGGCVCRSLVLEEIPVLPPEHFLNHWQETLLENLNISLSRHGA